MAGYIEHYYLTNCDECGKPTTLNAMVVQAGKHRKYSVCGIDCRDKKVEKLKQVGFKTVRC